MTTKFSINLNKIALIRNSRGENFPDLKEIASLVIEAGCHSITLHPREDERHATLEDVKTLSELGPIKKGQIELNIEGNLRDDLITVLLANKVHQFTIVPVIDQEKTTTRGWQVDENSSHLSHVISLFKPHTRISLFVEPDIEIVEYAANVGVNAIEFHTKWYAKAFGHQNEHEEINRLKIASRKAKDLGLRVHLGHDLNLQNIPRLIQEIQPDEVSIGHALIVESLIMGLPKIIKQYNQLFLKPFS